MEANEKYALPLIANAADKFEKLREKVFAFSSIIVEIFNRWIPQLQKRFKHSNLLPRDSSLLQYTRYILCLMKESLVDFSVMFAHVFDEIEYYSNLDKNAKTKFGSKYNITIPKSFLIMNYLLNNKFLYVPHEIVTINSLQNLLDYVPFVAEWQTGKYDHNVQDEFERIFLLKNTQLLDPLFMVSFNDIDIDTIENISLKIAQNVVSYYKIKTNLSQVLLCVYRFIYPYVYIRSPIIFPHRTSQKIDRSENESVNIDQQSIIKASSYLDQLLFHIVPHEMIYLLCLASKTLVEGFMNAHSLDIRAQKEFGAQQLLPLIEETILLTYNPFILDILRWLDSYCQDTEFSDSSSYSVTAFYSIAQFHFELN